MHLKQGHFFFMILNYHDNNLLASIAIILYSIKLKYILISLE